MSFFIIACLPLIAALPANAGPRIGGAVLDAAGQPVAGASVRLHPVSLRHETGEHLAAGRPGIPSLKETFSTETGAFRLKAPDIGMWRLQVDAPGKVAMQIRLTPLLEDVELQPVELRDDVGADLQVLDEGDRPIRDAAVVMYRQTPSSEPSPSGSADYAIPLWHPAPFLGSSDEAGFVRVPVAQDEAVQIQVVAPGFPALTGSAQRRNRELTEEIWRFVLPTAPTGSLKVIDDQGRPVPDALIFADRRPFPISRTDEDGSAPLTLATGQSTLLSISTTDGRWAVYTLTAEREEAGHVELVLKAPEMVRGRVLDRLTGEALAGALVWPSRLVGRAVIADRRGEFAVQLVRGEDSLTAGAAGYRPAYRRAGLMRPLRTDSAPPSLVLELQPVGAVSGLVVDGNDEPVAGVEILPMPGNHRRGVAQAISAADGTFYVERLFAGTPYRMLLRPPETPSLSEDGQPRAVAAPTWIELGSLTAGEHRRGLIWQLEQARPAVGWVVGENDEPLFPARVALKRDRGPGGDDSDLYQGPPDVFTAFTDVEGRYVIPALPAARYDLNVTMEGFVPAVVPGWRAEPDEVSGSGPWELGTVTLIPGETLSGQVVDDAGRGIEGAEVQIRRTTPLGFFGGRLQDKLVTDRNGRFEVRGLAPDLVLGLFVHADGFVEQESITVRLPTDEEVRITLKRGSSIRGKVVDHLGWPVARARVTAFGRAAWGGAGNMAVTDETGDFEIDRLPAGAAKLEVRADDFLARRFEVEVGEPGQEPLFIEVELEPGAVLHGRVLTNAGEPVHGARVTAFGQNLQDAQSAESDGDGRFIIGGLPRGSLQVRAYKEPYVTEQVDMLLEGDEGFVELEIDAGSEVWGRVVDENGEAVTGVTVVLTHDQGRPTPTPVKSEPDGGFAFDHVQPGSYVLRVASGSIHSKLDIQVPGAHDLEVILTEGSRRLVTGQVVGLELDALAEIVIAARGNRYVAGQVAFDGSFEIPGLEAGEWTISAAEPRDRRAVSQTIELRDDEPQPEIILEFEPGVNLEGRLLISGSEERPSRVSFVQAGLEGSRHVPIAPDGSFVLRNLTPGSYKVTFIGKGGSAWYRRVDVRTDRTWEVAIEVAELVGRVVRRRDDGEQVGVSDCGVVLTPLEVDETGESNPVSTITRSDGSFRFAAVELGTYTLTTHITGFGQSSRSVLIQGPSEPLEIELSP